MNPLPPYIWKYGYYIELQLSETSILDTNILYVGDLKPKFISLFFFWFLLNIELMPFWLLTDVFYKSLIIIKIMIQISFKISLKPVCEPPPHYIWKYKYSLGRVPAQSSQSIDTRFSCVGFDSRQVDLGHRDKHICDIKPAPVANEQTWVGSQF